MADSKGLIIGEGRLTTNACIIAGDKGDTIGGFPDKVLIAETLRVPEKA